MDLRIQFPDPAGYPDWRDWANQLNASLERLLLPTPEDQFPIVLLGDRKAQNTPGGTFTSGAWQVRELNYEYDPVGICILNADSSFTLAPGRYLIFAICPASDVGSHQARLWNVTDNVLHGYGTTELVTQNMQSRSFLIGPLQPKKETAYRLEHMCETTKATIGFGEPGNFGNEIYTQVILWGLA